jgi:Heparinase II/III-like protein/Heparinase II/III N-terminus
MVDWRYLKASGHLSPHTPLVVEGAVETVTKVAASALSDWAGMRDDEIVRDVLSRHPRKSELDAAAIREGELEIRPGLTVEVADWDSFWLEPPIEERNAGWRMNSMLMLDGLTSHAQHAVNYEAADMALAILHAWARANVGRKPASAMAWHDHATALRQTRILRLYEVMRRLDRLNANEHRFFIKLAAMHANALRDEKFFSGFNNHGLDQSIALYMSSRVMGMCEQAVAWRDVSRTRILALLEQQFTHSDCVHVENSPEYHASVLLRFVHVRHMFEHYEDHEPLAALDSVLSRAMAFLGTIMRPNGFLPLLGDTEERALNVRAFKDLKGSREYRELAWLLTDGETGNMPRTGFRLFEEAGYAVYADYPEGEIDYRRVMHLVMKCGLKSTYHRHDDDNSITLHALGRDWLIDSGLFLHEAADKRRIYVRSPAAHTVSMPLGASTRRQPFGEPDAFWGVRESEAGEGVLHAVTGTSRMFVNHTYDRRLDIMSATAFRLHDRIVSHEPSPRVVASCFQVPADLVLVSCDDASEVVFEDGEGRRFTIRKSAGPDTSLDVVCGQDGDELRGWTSPRYNVLEPCHHVRFRTIDSAETTELSFILQLEAADS